MAPDHKFVSSFCRQMKYLSLCPAIIFFIFLKKGELIFYSIFQNEIH